MNIRFLETFVWLCRLQNFNAVAEKLHTTQPSVSQRISTLEDLFRQKLYVRGGRQFELTAAGRHLLPYAERIVDLSDEMHRELIPHEELESVLNVGIIEVGTLSFLAEWVRLIAEFEPAATLDITTGTSAELVDRLTHDELDLAFVWGAVNEPGITNTHISSFPLVWLGSTSVFNVETELNVVDLAKLPIIMNREGTSGYSMILDYFKANGVPHVPLSTQTISLNCSYSLATAMSLVRSGMGVMALPPFLMAEEIARGEVAILPVSRPLPEVDVTACTRNKSGNPLIEKLTYLALVAAKAFSDEIGSQFCRV